MARPSRGPADRDPDPTESVVERTVSHAARLLPLALVAAPLGPAFNVATALKVAEMAEIETVE